MLQDYIDDYENIMTTLERLYDDVSSKELQDEIFSLIEMFRMDCEKQKQEYEEDLMQESKADVRALNDEYDEERF